MREPGGHRSIPYAMELALRALPVAQRSILISLAFAAQWEPCEREVRGMRVEIDIGEALISYQALARDLRVAVDLVRRAIASGVRIGLISARRAIPPGGTPNATGYDTYRGTPHGTPPTIVRFMRHREILWRSEKRDTACDIPRDTGGGTIPQNTGTQNTGQQQSREREQCRRGARGPRRVSTRPGPSSPLPPRFSLRGTGVTCSCSLARRAPGRASLRRTPCSAHERRTGPCTCSSTVSQRRTRSRANFASARWAHTRDLWHRVFDERLWDALSRMPVLVLDDAGAEPRDDRATPLLASLLCERVDAARKTVVTTNLDYESFRARYGDRVADRMTGRAWYGTQGPSLRGRTEP